MIQPIPPVDTLTVFSFSYYDFDRRDTEVALYKATREAIMAANGVVWEGTEEVVPRDVIDERGHYRRRATGWGVRG